MKQYFLKYNEFLNESLSSARKKYRDSGVMGIEFFDSLVNADPTPTKKYLEKMCEWYMETKEDVNDIKSYVEKFHRLLPTLEIKDINKYGSFKEFKKLLTFKDSNTARKKGITKDIEVVYETDKVQVTHPKTYEESCILGAGTQWCTASRDIKQHWDNYTKENLITFYYIWFKDLDGIDSKFYKVAIGVDPKGRLDEIRDAEDQWVNNNLLKKILDKYSIPLDLFVSRINIQKLWDKNIEKIRMNGFDISLFIEKYKSLIDLDKCWKDIININLDDLEKSEIVAEVMGYITEYQTQENFDYLVSMNPRPLLVFTVMEKCYPDSEILSQDNWNTFKELMEADSTDYSIRAKWMETLIKEHKEFQQSYYFRDFVECAEETSTKEGQVLWMSYLFPQFKKWYEKFSKQK